MEVNQQLIAERLGISRATVSRCFTNHAGISPVTRSKVFQMAAELGYTHQEARTTTTKKEKAQPKFSVLICSEKQEYYDGEYQSPGEQILAGVSEFAQVYGASIEINLISPTVASANDPEFENVEALRDRKNRGILLIYPFPAAVIDELSLRFPLVSLVDQHDLKTIDYVDVNHHDGISNIVDHLVEQGHQKIGFYTRDYQVEASWSFRRYSAFIEKMARLRLSVQSEDIIGVFPCPQMDLEESIDKAEKRSRDGVTAWVCAADHQAYDLVEGLNQRGLNIPKDVSVTGFDGIWRGGADPNLTTIDIPYRAIGITGAERLAARIGKRFMEKQHIYISGKLHQGRTTASVHP